MYNASRYVAKNKNFRKDIKQDVEFEGGLSRWNHDR